MDFPIEETIKKTGSKALGQIKTHWIDILLLFIVLLCLGVFNCFALKRNDDFLKPEYWYHFACRLVAYVCASIIGIRIRYPVAKNAHEGLKKILEENEKLASSRGEDFQDFINSVNDRVKKATWILKINKKLSRLEWRFPVWCIQYERKREDRFLIIKGKVSAKRKAKAEKYCKLKAELEYLKSEEYINENLPILPIKTYIIRDRDFDVEIEIIKRTTVYKTRKNTTLSSAEVVLNILFIAAIISALFGSVTLSFDESVAYGMVVGVVSAIINCLIDVGLTLWKFLQGLRAGEKLVETEDLTVAVDKNKLLKEYYSLKKA